MARMADKVALVTGGAGGLGSAIARRLDTDGGIVVVADLDDAAGTASLDEWHKVLGVNLDGTFLGCKHVLPVMKEARKGSIVNISSIVSYMSTPSTVAYGASKAGVQQLTKSVAISGCQDGMRIRCNSVHPGVMQTRMIDSILAQVSQALGISEEQAAESALSKVPLGHIGEPDDVAYLVLYLASDESKYVTGSEFMVDGGWHLGQAS